MKRRGRKKRWNFQFLYLKLVERMLQGTNIFGANFIFVYEPQAR